MIRRVTESELPLCLRVIHEAFGTVAEDFGLTPDNCPTNGASVFPVPCAETAKRRIPAIHFQGRRPRIGWRRILVSASMPGFRG